MKNLSRKETKKDGISLQRKIGTVGVLFFFDWGGQKRYMSKGRVTDVENSE